MITKLVTAAVTVATVIYAMPLIAWLIARTIEGESLWAVGYMNAVGIWWFAPLLVLLPVALLVRARLGSILGGLLLLPFLWFYGADFVPGLPQSIPEDAVTLRVMTFNTLFVNGDFAGVIERIRENDPDVIAAQELAPDLDDAITTALAESHPYKITNSWPDPRGIGLWSRYPMTEGENRTTERWEWWMHEVNLDVEGRPVAIYNLHLWPIGTTDPAGFRIALAAQHQQVDELMAMLETETSPVIVVGDFNASPTNENYQTLTTVLDDAWSEVGWGTGFTFPAQGMMSTRVPPFLRIDYLMSKGNIRPLSIKVLEKAGSDHLPVIGEFLIE
jgi:endonuclease/exonuclease/phosphatase (EEP) superfamily protein YafD